MSRDDMLPDNKHARLSRTLTGELEMRIPLLAETPKYVRIICQFSFWATLLLGVLLVVKNDRGDVRDTVLGLLIALLIPVVLVTLLLTLYHVMDHFTCKHALALLNAEYAEKGFTENLPKYAVALHPLPTTDDRLLELYLTVMAEHYDALPALYMRLEKRKRTERQQAMLNLCKIRALMMNGKPDKALKLYREEHLLMDAAYEEQPDLISQRVPRSYTDDTLTYCEAAAGFCVRSGDLREAEHYRSFAALRISNRDEDEQPFLTEILDIEMEYAAGNAAAVRDRVTALEQEIKEKFQLTQRGKYINLTRKLRQAAIFLAITLPGTEPADKQQADRERFARRLPGADYLSGGGK